MKGVNLWLRQQSRVADMVYIQTYTGCRRMHSAEKNYIHTQCTHIKCERGITHALTERNWMREKEGQAATRTMATNSISIRHIQWAGYEKWMLCRVYFTETRRCIRARCHNCSSILTFFSAPSSSFPTYSPIIFVCVHFVRIFPFFVHMFYALSLRNFSSFRLYGFLLFSYASLVWIEKRRWHNKHRAYSGTRSEHCAQQI